MTMLGEGATKHSAATAVGNVAPAAGLIKVMIVDNSAVVRGQVGSGWEITPDIRAMVRFRADNLVLDSQETGGFDVIFCRNVLIYFDEDTKRRVLAKLASKLAGDGYLVLGAAETTTGLKSGLRRRAGGSAWRVRHDEGGTRGKSGAQGAGGRGREVPRGCHAGCRARLRAIAIGFAGHPQKRQWPGKPGHERDAYGSPQASGGGLGFVLGVA